MNMWSGQPKNDTKTLFFNPPSPFPGTVLAFVLLHNSRFNFHCYTRHEATPTQKSARKWRFDLLQLLAWKITKGIHLRKPASLNCPINKIKNKISNASFSPSTQLERSMSQLLEAKLSELLEAKHGTGGGQTMTTDAVFYICQPSLIQLILKCPYL